MIYPLLRPIYEKVHRVSQWYRPESCKQSLTELPTLSIEQYLTFQLVNTLEIKMNPAIKRRIVQGKRWVDSKQNCLLWSALEIFRLKPGCGQRRQRRSEPDSIRLTFQKLHGGNGLKFYILMYLERLQNWLVYGHGLLIFLILVQFWLSETGQIWGFRAFPGECMEEMASNFARWIILTTFKTDQSIAMVCWFF